MNYDVELAALMQQEESIVKKILGGESPNLSRVDIEDILLEIKRMQRESEFLKELKKHRVAPIDRKIKSFDQDVITLRESILECMKSNGDTKLDFPDVGKVTTRKTPISFEVEDDSKVEDHLRSLGIIEDVAEPIWKFDKKKLNKVFVELKDNNNLPAGVKVVEPSTAISIAFDEKADSFSKIREEKQDADRWKKVEEKVQNYDYDKMVI